MSAETNPPAHASVVVIGGGVMGCSTLYHLAKRGVSDAILLERNKLTSGTTWHSAAQVRALRSTRNMTELIRYSIQLYSDLERETGQATGWIGKGSLSVATTPDRLAHVRRQQALADLFGVEARFATREEAREIWPLMNAEDVIGAVWSPDDGRVSPSDLCAALVKGAKARGARVFEDVAVSGIVTEGGRIKAVETPGGAIRTDAVAACAGLWSGAVAAMAGESAPLWPCEHFYLLTKPVDGIIGNTPTLSDHDQHLYIRDDSGGLLVGCFEPMGKPIAPEALGEDFAFQLLPEDWDHFEPMMAAALHRLPALETAEVKMLLNGPESFTPDGAFMLGETAGTRGLFLGCGMNSVGVATGGGAGKALADAIVDGHLPVDLHEVEPSRFDPAWNHAEALAARAPEVLGKHYEITYPGRQWATARALRPTPLDAAWRAADAYFGQVGAWERPLYFAAASVSDGPPPLTFDRPIWHEQVGREVAAAHRKAAIFDQSTFGKIRVSGPDAERFLNRLCANRMDRAPGRAIYTAMLNARGGIESDLTALRIGDEEYRLYVGTSAIRRDLGWLRRHLDADERVEIVDETADWAILGLMGPDASDIVERLGAGAFSQLRYFRHTEAEIAGARVRAARLSYVGEAGWELTIPVAQAGAVYDAVVAHGAAPAGLFAQTAMRIEKRFLAYGHDLDADIDPLSSGLGFAIGWETPFIGREALAAKRDAPAETITASLMFDDAVATPLGHEPVLRDGRIIGRTTSAAFGYRVERPVAISRIAREALGETVMVNVAGAMLAARCVDGPIFDPEGLRLRG